MQCVKISTLRSLGGEHSALFKHLNFIIYLLEREGRSANFPKLGARANFRAKNNFWLKSSWNCLLIYENLSMAITQIYFPFITSCKAGGYNMQRPTNCPLLSGALPVAVQQVDAAYPNPSRGLLPRAHHAKSFTLNQILFTIQSACESIFVKSFEIVLHRICVASTILNKLSYKWYNKWKPRSSTTLVENSLFWNMGVWSIQTIRRGWKTQVTQAMLMTIEMTNIRKVVVRGSIWSY